MVSVAFRAGRKKLAVGAAPLVVGTLSSLFSEVAARDLEEACNIVEVRLDHTPRPSDWQQRCLAIETLGWPVVLTARSAAEGGNWEGTEEARLSALRWAVEHLAGVDVELSSALAGPVATQAREKQKVCIVSFHDFHKTPPLPELRTIVSKAWQLGSIAKISTMIVEDKDVDSLRALLDNHPEHPLCVIAMGDAWQHTRVSFAALGSCLTYGYLDRSAAPGQMPARELSKQLRQGDCGQKTPS